MTSEQINSLLSKGEYSGKTGECKLIETHISWVMICDDFVYKIKKPVQYSFLDFSTLELRKYYCYREVELNKRLTQNIYLEVLPINEWRNKITIGGIEGTIIDYAVKMRKLNTEKRMDRLLTQHLVAQSDIKNLAEKIASFHKSTIVIREKDLMDIGEKFNDLKAENEYIIQQMGRAFGVIISNALKSSDEFMDRNKALLAYRLSEGFYRDCHGDLHSRNIFLLPDPVPFDCIEFNDDFRQIDVLNEVAFLCMDLDSFGCEYLSALFLEYYNDLFPTMKTKSERDLFIYYKSYRANIRAKVNVLRAKSATTREEKSKALVGAEKYFSLMESYLEELRIA